MAINLVIPNMKRFHSTRRADRISISSTYIYIPMSIYCDLEIENKYRAKLWYTDKYIIIEFTNKGDFKVMDAKISTNLGRTFGITNAIKCPFVIDGDRIIIDPINLDTNEILGVPIYST